MLSTDRRLVTDLRMLVRITDRLQICRSGKAVYLKIRVYP